MKTKHLILIACTLAVTAVLAVGCSGDRDDVVQGPVVHQLAADEAMKGSSLYCDYDVESSAPAVFSVANDIMPFQTVFGTDFVTAGVGGMRNVGTGTITLAGITGPVSLAYLYWHGPTNSADPAANANVMVNGNPVTGANIGFSSDNCWGFTNSQGYRADVTALVQGTGNGAYNLTGFGSGSVNTNGASMVVFFDDGDNSNNRDVVMFDGNDSNISNPFDADGWNVSLPGINYTAGTANLEMHVADGQTFTDDAIIVNAAVFLPTGGIFDGNSVPSANNGPGNNGSLWDIRVFDVTGFMVPGPNTLTMTTGVFSDCLALTLAIIDLPAGAAPGQPVVFDFHPTSCPSPMNVKSKGVSPAALLGSADFDVADIDPSTILIEGVAAPIRWKINDVSQPGDQDECPCSTDGPDGFADLTLKFKTQDIVAALTLDPAVTEIELTITGELFDGTPFEASDCIKLTGMPKLPKDNIAP